MSEIASKDRHGFVVFTPLGRSAFADLRAIGNLLGCCREDAFEGFSVEEVVNQFRACWASPWDILPDELTHAERRAAGRTGRLTKVALRRLEKKYG